MASNKPVIHGPDHRPGGADPIPGIGDGIRFNVDNEGGWLEVVTNDHFESPNGDMGMFLEDTSEKGIDIVARDAANTKQASIYLDPNVIDLILSSAGPKLSLNRTSDQIEVNDGDVDMNSNGIVDLRDGVNPQDAATVAQLLAIAGIRFAIANVGTYLDVETTGNDGSQGIHLHDTDSGGGINLESDSGFVGIQGTAYVALQGGAAGVTAPYVQLDDTGVNATILAGTKFVVLNHSSAPILSTDEGTGVTTGTFDGGTP